MMTTGQDPLLNEIARLEEQERREEEERAREEEERTQQTMEQLAIEAASDADEARDGVNELPSTTSGSLQEGPLSRDTRAPSTPWSRPMKPASPGTGTGFVVRGGRPVKLSFNSGDAGKSGRKQGMSKDRIKALRELQQCDHLLITPPAYRPRRQFQLVCARCGRRKLFDTMSGVLQLHVSSPVRSVCLGALQFFALITAVVFEVVFICIHVTLFVNSQTIPVCSRKNVEDILAKNVTDPDNPLYFPSCDELENEKARHECKTAPLGCFDTMWSIIGTVRWFYVIALGIALGILVGAVVAPSFLSIAQCCARIENHKTENAYQAAFVRKSFGFVWIGVFLWPFIVAFVYVPFGQIIFDRITQALIAAYPDVDPGEIKSSFVWLTPRNYARRMMQLDLMFVCPLIVTQIAELLIDTFAPIYFYRFKEWRERNPEICARCCKWNQRSAVDRLIQREQVRRWRAAQAGLMDDGSSRTIQNDENSDSSPSLDRRVASSVSDRSATGQPGRHRASVLRRASFSGRGGAQNTGLSHISSVVFGESDMFGPGLVRAFSGGKNPRRAVFMIAARDKSGKPARARHLRSIFHVSFKMAKAKPAAAAAAAGAAASDTMAASSSTRPADAGALIRQSSDKRSSGRSSRGGGGGGGAARAGADIELCVLEDGARADAPEGTLDESKSGSDDVAAAPATMLRVGTFTSLLPVPVSRSNPLGNVSAVRVQTLEDDVGLADRKRARVGSTGDGPAPRFADLLAGGVEDAQALEDSAVAEEFLRWTAADERRSHAEFQVSLVEDIDDGLICVSYVPPRTGSMYIAVTGGASHSIKAHLQGSPFRVEVVEPPKYRSDDDITMWRKESGDEKAAEGGDGAGSDAGGAGGEEGQAGEDIVKFGWMWQVRGIVGRTRTVRRLFKAYGASENYRIDYYEVNMTSENGLELKGTLQLSLGFTVDDFQVSKRLRDEGLAFGFKVSRAAMGRGETYKFLVTTAEELKSWKQVRACKA